VAKWGGLAFFVAGIPVPKRQTKTPDVAVHPGLVSMKLA